MSHGENLIDLSPPPSGASSPVRPNHSNSPAPRAERKPQTDLTSSYHSTHSNYSNRSTYSTNAGGGSGGSGGNSSYGFGSALSGLWKRLSSVDSTGLQHSLASAQSQLSATMSTLGSDGDGIHGAYTPPRRAVSPRVLPSLEPLVLNGYAPDTDPDERLLSRGIAEEIRTFIPERLKISDSWSLVYSLYQHGSSLSTLYKLCDDYRGSRAGFILVVRDAKEGTFGAYLTEPPHPASHYFGTGECFLWRASLHAPLPPPPSADTADLNFRATTIADADLPSSPTNKTTCDHDSSPGATLAPTPTDPTTGKAAAKPPAPAHSIRFQNFAYTGADDYCMFCETGFLSVGGGGGRFGLWLNDSLSMGHSSCCDTFGNQGLSDQGDKFDVLGVELWVVGATTG